MSPEIIVKPVALALDLEAAKRRLRIDGSDLDLDITQAIKGITDDIEHITQRSLINRTLRLRMDGFPQRIRLECPPVVSISSIKFYDTDNVLQELSEADYEVEASQDSIGYIVPLTGCSWPNTYRRSNAVIVEWIAGHGASHEDIPDGIKEYMLAQLAIQLTPGLSGDLQLSRKLDRFKVYG